MGKAYTVIAGEDTICTTDFADTAITNWFKGQKENPSDVCILASSKQKVISLINFAYNHKDFIESRNERYKIPYKLEFIMNIINRDFNDKCKSFIGEMDQVGPFSVG